MVVQLKAVECVQLLLTHKADPNTIDVCFVWRAIRGKGKNGGEGGGEKKNEAEAEETNHKYSLFFLSLSLCLSHTHTPLCLGWCNRTISCMCSWFKGCGGTLVEIWR